MPRAPKPLPAVEILRVMFTVTADGRLVNRISRTARKSNELADRSTRGGYRTSYVDGSLHFTHRLIWKIVHGCDPAAFIDHINGDHFDNRPENLRECSHVENMLNKKRSSNNTSGVKGVHLRKDNGMYRAYLTVDGERINLGQYSTRAEAEAVVAPARHRLHGQFARFA